MVSVHASEQFKKNAGRVSAIVHTVPSVTAALSLAVSLCEASAFPRFRDPGTDLNADPHRPVVLPQAPAIKTIAAPDLSPKEMDCLSSLCRDRLLQVVTGPLRDETTGVDMGITSADYGIIDTGTLVISSDSEDLRLATMICNIHVALLPRHRLRASALELNDELEAMMSTAHTYTAFITGASRTADIERVLALGVHGPLALHIMLLEE